NGGAGGDVLFGGGGGDRLSGGGGAHGIVGEGGDATLVWENGGGRGQGRGGERVEQGEGNGSPTGGGAFTGGPTLMGPVRVEVQRTNLIRYTLDLIEPQPGDDGIEALTINGGGGADQLTVSPGVSPLSVSADGGADDDALVGSDESDTFSGSTGNDVLTPG